MGAIQCAAGTLPIAFDPHHSPARGFLGPRWVAFERSRVRESRTLGSVGAKAEWLSYPTTAPGAGLGKLLPPLDQAGAIPCSRLSSATVFAPVTPAGRSPFENPRCRPAAGCRPWIIAQGIFRLLLRPTASSP